MNALLQGATWDDFTSWLPDLWSGFVLSIEVTIASLAVGLPLGLALALGVQTKAMLLRGICLAVVEIGRGAPALVLLQFIYFGLPSAGLPLTSFVSATIALGWSTGAYTSEIIRAGLDSVPGGHKEAVSALGLSRMDGLRYVILPQGLRVAVPALLGFSILVFQASSLCFTIALPELISRAYEIGTNTFFYFPALATAGLFYVAICMPASFLVSYVEHRAGAYAVR
ncbi:amino acid ABC transporter permease [Lichenifustis flavocetrariae]|uniref:Amino acid ABC transporter permease n=1 Tax=Lichenifustis flavocetrariae TaxID=2949735 RepID=A0AA42CM71_9HYPH|nr:amino acid ABC transporter permease [Lichenifustis flavocetrariae]MCW6511236.1 amino acid ABC transporter permease [Lichenifustis flavocetrariae]